MNRQYLESEIRYTEQKIPRILEYKGKITKTPRNLLSFLEEYFLIKKDISRIYGFLKREKDFEFVEKLMIINRNLSNITFFLLPEIKEITDEDFKNYKNQEPELEKYKELLENLKIEVN